MRKITVRALFLGLMVAASLAAIRVVKRDASISNQQKQILFQIQDNNFENKGGTILYYGIACPHCGVVEEWLEENPKTKEKSGLITKEVYENQKNSRELVEKARECQIEEGNGIGVPFLYDNGECIVGDQPIIDYLKGKYQ